MLSALAGPSLKANSRNALILLAAVLTLFPTITGTRSNSFVPVLASTGPVLYDEQLSLNFVDNFTSLAVNVTAVQQCGSDGLGPAYILNGLSELGYWYQVGLSWNWPLLRTDKNGNVNVTSSSGFNAVFETWDPYGNELTVPTLYPVSVNRGDAVQLGLRISGGAVFMDLRDLITGASATQEWSARESKLFVGTPQSATRGGFFTGLMTEQYRTSSYYGDEQKVKYELSGSTLSSAWMVFDEWVPDNRMSIFWQASRVNYVSPTDSKSFTYSGAFETSNPREFVTGGLDSGPTCASVLPFWVTYRYPIIGVGAATVAITGVLIIRRSRNQTKAPVQRNDSLIASSFAPKPPERPQ